MTDTEIIKALECCTDCNCKECPCCRIIDGGIHCTEIDEEEILALINRQKAEIERLEKEKDSKLVMCVANDKEKIKSEAIKEFAERLCEGRVSNDPVVIAVKVELKGRKEMTGKNDDE